MLSAKGRAIAMAGVVLALAASGCAETDRGLEAREDVKQIDQEVESRARELNRAIDPARGQPGD